MKNIAIVFIALSLLLSSCQKTVSDNYSSLAETSSATKQTEKTKKYVGKQSYNDVSLGAVELAQDSDNYYYTDCENFYSINKQTKKRELLIMYAGLIMDQYNDSLFFLYSGYNSTAIFDLSTASLQLESQKPLSSALEAHNGYDNMSIPLVLSNGYLFNIYNTETSDSKFFLTDKDYNIKEQLYFSGEPAFSLDNDLFYIGEDGNIYCYKLATKKNFYVTSFNPLPEQSDIRIFRGNSVKYLGKDKILVYGTDAFQILSLSDGSVFQTIPFKITDENFSTTYIGSAYDDENMYFSITNQKETVVYKINHQSKAVSTLYKYANSSSSLGATLCLVDDQYLYFAADSHYDAENLAAKGCHFRIKKDGSGKEILFEHFPNEYYEIDSPIYNETPKFVIEADE